MRARRPWRDHTPVQLCPAAGVLARDPSPSRWMGPNGRTTSIAALQPASPALFTCAGVVGYFCLAMTRFLILL